MPNPVPAWVQVGGVPVGGVVDGVQVGVPSDGRMAASRSHGVPAVMSVTPYRPDDGKRYCPVHKVNGQLCSGVGAQGTDVCQAHLVAIRRYMDKLAELNTERPAWPGRPAAT